MQEIKKINLSLEFETIKISHFVDDMKNGGTPRRNVSKYWENGTIPWLKTGEINNSPILDNSEYITEEGLKKSSAKVLPINSVIMALYGKGTAGRVGLLKFEATTNQACCAMICKDRIKSEYLYYYLLSIQPQIELLANGSVQQNLSKEILADYDINVPKNYQDLKNIVWILKNIDQKIENNKSINKNLFNIIDFIFKDYVGDYEDLEIVSLSENTQEIIRGFNSKYVEKSNIKNFNQKVNKGTFLEKQHFKYLDENIEIPKAKFAKKRDVLVNSLGDGTVGRPHYYNEDTDNVVVDQHITIIRANEDLIPSTYIYEYLKNSTGQYHLDSLISGSTGMLMLNISEIRNLKIPILDKKNLREFDTTVTPLFDKITKNFEEIYCLSKLRDTLLPKLMSGEIDVSKINCDLKIIIRKIYIKSSKLFLWRYLSENQNHIKNTKSNETLLKSRTIHKINKFLAKFNARYRYYRQQ